MKQEDKKPGTIKREKPKDPTPGGKQAGKTARTEAQAKKPGPKPAGPEQARRPYINLLQDAMFRAFVSKDERLIRSLADAFIFHPKGKKIQSLTIKAKGGKEWVKEALADLKDSSKHPKFPGGKSIVLDILAVLNTGETVHIEMQTVPHAFFKERTVYYWSEIYGGDFRSGEGYGALKPARSLIFVNFSLFPQSEDMINSFSIRSDKPPHFILTNHFGMVFVDLSRFRPPEGGSKNLLDLTSAWCYFIKRSADLSDKDLKALFQINEVFKMADAVLKDLSSEKEVRVLEKLREKQLHDHVSDLSCAREEGLQKGLRKGLQKGLHKGRIEIILNMLKEKFAVSAVSKATGAPEAEILALQAGESLKNGD